MTDLRRRILRELTEIQNHPDNHHRDILTFTGFLSDAELPAYLEQHRSQIAEGAD
jgi:hypothetical protein